jgi:hypothetical protein
MIGQKGRSSASSREGLLVELPFASTVQKGGSGSAQKAALSTITRTGSRLGRVAGSFRPSSAEQATRHASPPALLLQQNPITVAPHISAAAAFYRYHGGAALIQQWSAF